MLDVIGKSRNIELFWDVLHEMGCRGLVNDKTCRIALKTLASAREMKKCIEFFHVMNGFGCCYSLETLNKVVETLCKSKLVVEAKYVVIKLRDWIKPNGVTYKFLISGFCDVGDLIEASKVWNLMVDEGFELDIDSIEEMMATLFKSDRFGEAMKLFQMMRTNRIDVLGVSTYGLVINWMCKKGKLGQAHLVVDEMQKRGIQGDNMTMASLIYGLLTKCRVREAYMIMEGIEKPDITMYHGMIKGLLKLRRASEATQVFREMIEKGCEPIMHTYIMLLQGHLGKRGRKGSDPLVNFDTIFVGGLVKAGKSLEATKSEVDRSLSKDNIIIVDSLNSIKGYRYELWCLARAAGIRYCVVYCDVEETHCRKWNEQRRERVESSYNDRIFDDLVSRFEKPDRRNRWDSPLFELWPFKDGVEKSSPAIVDAVLYLTKEVDSKTKDVRVLQPTIATQTARVSEANSLYEMDRATQEVMSAIMEAQSRAIGGPVNGITLGHGLPTVNISRAVGLPELRRLRRTFIKLTGQSSLSGPPPPSDAESAKRMFVDYLNRELETA
ncbi:putative pentatricopeptide repeat-containing protein [Camellia lanceoleosa]|uniref:Pentatricopeptide repeat-containing protein n=1 Tax=Camellia lanceoleosa TaxID=1840588 RepID=A0ACC0IDX4_9ERIC|nr:putative pentatricopeptide repeat-containing protein [Camellia lanceoleosa]